MEATLHDLQPTLGFGARSLVPCFGSLLPMSLSLGRFKAEKIDAALLKGKRHFLS